MFNTPYFHSPVLVAFISREQIRGILKLLNKCMHFTSVISPGNLSLGNNQMNL
jgi:hypothetical protein